MYVTTGLTGVNLQSLQFYDHSHEKIGYESLHFVFIPLHDVLTVLLREWAWWDTSQFHWLQIFMNSTGLVVCLYTRKPYYL